VHKERIELWRHQNEFNIGKRAVERRTLIVVVITTVMMIAEVVFGWLSNSMALFADGWHMGTHAFALGISLLAYVLARRYARDPRFAFGAWRIEILGAYTSAIVLGMIALLMALTSVERLVNPRAIAYDQALIVAILGLVVNATCAVILDARSHSDEHDHHHGEHVHAHNHKEHVDFNLKSAYLHVVADAVTSVLAIAALLGAKYLGWNWLDPAMGIVGAALILRWAISLSKDTSGILLEVAHQTDTVLGERIKSEIESDGDTRVSDLHLWKVAQDKYACIVSLVTGTPRSIEEYRGRLNTYSELAHVTIEVNSCQGGA
jgi:cation diffusion facilitator family transporter